MDLLLEANLLCCNTYDVDVARPAGSRRSLALAAENKDDIVIFA